jgi:hypothetical protein
MRTLSVGLRRLGPALLLSLALPGCINQLVVDVQMHESDSGVVVLDAGTAPDDEDSSPTEPTPDTGIGPGPQRIDAGVQADAGGPDSALMDAQAKDSSSGGGGPDAAPDTGIIVEVSPAQEDAGDAGDASCKAATCDAGMPPGPCGSCGVVSFVKQECGNNTHDTCWTNPDGSCSMQCPPVTPCTAAGGCGVDEYCFFPENDCGKSGGGYCAKRLTCVPLQFEVCGCDGKDYKNGCSANQAGTAIASYTRCN